MWVVDAGERGDWTCAVMRNAEVADEHEVFDSSGKRDCSRIV